MSPFDPGLTSLIGGRLAARIFGLLSIAMSMFVLATPSHGQIVGRLARLLDDVGGLVGRGSRFLDDLPAGPISSAARRSSGVSLPDLAVDCVRRLDFDLPSSWTTSYLAVVDGDLVDTRTERGEDCSDVHAADEGSGEESGVEASDEAGDEESTLGLGDQDTVAIDDKRIDKV